MALPNLNEFRHLVMIDGGDDLESDNPKGARLAECYGLVDAEAMAAAKLETDCGLQSGAEFSQTEV